MRKYNDKSNVISNKLKKLRKEKSISQTQLCHKLELYGIIMTKEDLSKIEHANKIVKDFELWGIAKALSVSLDELLTELNLEFTE